MNKETISNEWIENNAWLIFRADFYPIYTERYWLWLSTDEKLILSFIHYWTKNWHWIYATNDQIAMLIESSESTAKRCIKALKDNWFILVEEKRTQTGTDRKLKFNKVLSQFPAQVINELSAQVKLTRAQGSNWPTEKNNNKKNNNSSDFQSENPEQPQDLNEHREKNISNPTPKPTKEELIIKLKERLETENFSPTLIEHIIEYWSNKKWTKLYKYWKAQTTAFIKMLKTYPCDDAIIALFDKCIANNYQWIWEYDWKRKPTATPTVKKEMKAVETAYWILYT